MMSSPSTIDLQPWPYSERPRVLIEHPSPDLALRLATAIRRSGCTVAICSGPEASRRCPLHCLEPCIAVEGADLVVTALDLRRDDSRDVLRGLRTRYPDTPLVVAATVQETLDLADLLEGCVVVPVDCSPERFAAAVLQGLVGAR